MSSAAAVKFQSSLLWVAMGRVAEPFLICQATSPPIPAIKKKAKMNTYSVDISVPLISSFLILLLYPVIIDSSLLK